MGEYKRGIYNTSSVASKRKELRNSSTAAEAVLWRHLQRRQLSGKKFRRQASIGPYIVDFYCPECRLVVELDGAPHFNVVAAEYDARREQYLQERGIRVIRFENRTIFADVESVLQAIRENVRN